MEFKDSIQKVKDEIPLIYRNSFRNEGLDIVDFSVLRLSGGGLCGANAVSSHLYGNELKGKEIREYVNKHKLEFWEYYKVEYYYPYDTPVGNSLKVFQDENTFKHFLANDPEASFIWFTHGDLQAVANIYNINVNIFTTGTPTEGPDGNSARWTNLRPDNTLKVAVEKYTGGEIYLYHRDEIHFDLIVKKKETKTTSKGAVDHIPMETDNPSNEEKEFCLNCESREHKIKDLEKNLSEKEKQISDLKREVETREKITKSKMEDPFDKADVSESDLSFQEVKSSKKRQRTNLSAKNKQIKKIYTLKFNANVSFQGSVIYCELCDYENTDSEAMMKHMMDSHNEDGDWLCNQCDYQTSRQKLFTNHIDRKHGKNDDSTKQAKCEFSGISLSSKDIVKEHDNKTYKPCKYFLESECKFGDQCRFSHNQLKKGEFICYVCGQTFNDLGSLMKHRKTDHTSVVCKSFQKGECKFNAKFCWWSHDKVPSTIQSTDFHDVQVFQQDQRNKAPPFREPSLSQSPAGENQSLSSQSTVQPEIRQVTGEEHQAVFLDQLHSMKAQLEQVAIWLCNVEKMYPRQEN